METPQSKFDRLKKIMEIISLDTMTPKDVEKFIHTVLEVIKKQKDEFQTLSAENLAIIKDSILYIEEINAKAVNSHDTKTNAMVEQIKELIDKVKTIRGSKIFSINTFKDAPKNAIIGDIIIVEDTNETYIYE